MPPTARPLEPLSSSGALANVSFLFGGKLTSLGTAARNCSSSQPGPKFRRPWGGGTHRRLPGRCARRPPGLLLKSTALLEEPPPLQPALAVRFPSCASRPKHAAGLRGHCAISVIAAQLTFCSTVALDAARPRRSRSIRTIDAQRRHAGYAGCKRLTDRLGNSVHYQDWNTDATSLETVLWKQDPRVPYSPVFCATTTR